jgi:hypothetical protein
MSHLVRRETWGAVDLDVELGRVFVQQTWHYHWLLEGGAAPWTMHEKHTFHHELDRQIWGEWSNRLRLSVTGVVAVARRFAATGVPINFDIRRVQAGGNWQVNAHKLPPRTAMSNAYRPNVTFGTRLINLYTPAVPPYRAANSAGTRRSGFRSTPHEFGHTIDNRDEYGTGDPEIGDADSIMNVGRQVRARHLTLILAVLNRMVAGCRFSL